MALKSLNAVALTVLCLGTVAAQGRPSFTGTWVQETGGAQPNAAATTLKITDSAPLLTIEQTTGENTETLTFSYIGEDEAKKLIGPRPDEATGANTVQETKAAWHDGHLDTYITRQINGKTVTQAMHYTLRPDSSHMTVERDLQVHHGYESSSGASASEKAVYVKQ